MTLPLGILLALVCAVTTNVGFLFKHRGACAAPPVDMRHPFRTARALYSSRLFAVGMLIACGAWIFHVAVMAVAPLGADAVLAFRKLAEVADGIRQRHPSARVISAGMSGDLEQAVANGATHLRVGSALLGARRHPVW